MEDKQPLPEEVHQKFLSLAKLVVENPASPQGSQTVEEVRVYEILEMGWDAAMNYIHDMHKSIDAFRIELRKRYEHRLDWFEKKYPQGLGYMDDGQYISIMHNTRIFLREAFAEDETELTRVQDKMIAMTKEHHDREAQQALVIAKLHLKIKEMSALLSELTIDEAAENNLSSSGNISEEK